MVRVNIFHKAAIFCVRSVLLLVLCIDGKTSQKSPRHPKGDVIGTVPEIYYRKFHIAGVCHSVLKNHIKEKANFMVLNKLFIQLFRKNSIDFPPFKMDK